MAGFAKFDAKLMLVSFFALVMLFGTLTGFGLLQDEIGEPPQLTEDGDPIVEFDPAQFPQQPGTLSGECEIDTTGEIFCGDFTYSESDHKAIVDNTGERPQLELVLNESTGDTYQFLSTREEYEAGNFRDSVPVNETDQRNWEIITPEVYNVGDATLIGDEIEIEYYDGVDGGTVVWTISYGENPSSSSGGIIAGIGDFLSGGAIGDVYEAVVYIGQILVWIAEYLIELLVTAIVGIFEVTTWIVSIFWYLISGWIAIGGLVGNTWISLIIQGITLGLFIGLANGVIKLIEAVR